MGCFTENSQNKVIYLSQIPITDRGKEPLERTKVAQRNHGVHPWRQCEKRGP